MRPNAVQQFGSEIMVAARPQGSRPLQFHRSRNAPERPTCRLDFNTSGQFGGGIVGGFSTALAHASIMPYRTDVLQLVYRGIPPSL